MGWTGIKTTDTFEAFVREYLYKCNILDLHLIDRHDHAVAYVLIDDGVKEVVVCLMEREGSYINIKIMGEDVGPCYYDCPKHWIALLPPTTKPYAVEWRRKVLA
jgi:hypothetical protein